MSARIPRSFGIAAIAAAFLVGLVSAHGCVDDRSKVAAQVFFCNPQSRTADADCGTGFVCYTAAQSVGGSICVARCNPDDQTTCPRGVCTASGACLARCTVADAKGCPEPLVCRRTTNSPLEVMAGNDGVCLPINASCATRADCKSPVFNACTSDVNGSAQGPGLFTSGEVCVQGSCKAAGIACQPGSACIPNVLPSTIPAPDVCSPICTPYRDRPKDGSPFNECLPGLTCLSDAFPQTDAPACAPGFPGWLCVDNLGCTAGGCSDWGDVDGRLKGFKTCAPTCKSDVDCVPYDRGGNPTFISKNTCHGGVCRNLASLFFPVTCLRDGDPCRLDVEGECRVPNPDMGPPGMGGGLGAFGGQAAACIHGCNVRSDCDTLSTTLKIPLTCVDVGTVRSCAPVIPFVTPCTDDNDCYGGLTCEGGAGKRVCTHRCMTSADCTSQPALGSSFGCIANVCVPRTPSGVQAPMADACLSGTILNGICVSPKDWACADDADCANGQCNIFPRSDPKFGRCN
ncbi:MAG: hypothetical protein JWN44_3740 [Myxococcales bacterium]|nr:hypothetical protein [Myxococcales bacterium]